MPWFKTDDAFWRHRKVRKLGRDKLPAVGLWQLAGSWCADNIDENLTDGFVPREQVESWDPRLRYAKRLVEVGLWREAEHDGEHGYEFHDWAEYQKTRAEVEAEREEWRQKKRKSRGRKMSPGDTPGDTNGDSREDSTKESNESPGTRSRTRTRSFSGHLEGEGPDSNAGASPRPPERCQKHANHADPPPCGACAASRRAAEAWDRGEAERERQRVDAERRERAAIRACSLCDGDGWRWNPAGKHRGVLDIRCNHHADQLEAS